MHDPVSIFRFDEHDVYLPMITLEELDNNKKGTTDASRNARQVSRELDALASDHLTQGQGLPLSKTGRREARGSIFFQTGALEIKLPMGLPDTKNDNQILGVVQALRAQQPDRQVVLVSKDINVRIKARALGLDAEDYFNDKTLNDGDVLYTGYLALPPNFWETHGKGMESWQTREGTRYRVRGPLVSAMSVNLFVYLEQVGEKPLYAKVVEHHGTSAVLQTLRDYSNPKNSVWGVVAKNREQSFAMNMLMDPDCDFVTLAGNAGTGKTLMTLAAALAQVFDDKRYSEVIITRATVSVGEDIGFLPGSEEEKMSPWMGAIDDNLEFLAANTTARGDWNRASTATNDVIRSKLKIKSMNFMRGRTFMNKFVILDEAQNLTPKQMKTLITRAGPGTKIVCMGNLAQIDTPYLTEGSSGLTYAVDRFKGWEHGGHVTLARGERSRLADFASEVL
ncbi:putative phosphorous metabolism-related protein (plasmid) [Methylibium petroleiphilum PM1]|uniref:Putative phosphorous metabolism-related protein n=2 Tax=Methylibium TaxID=316612 RepID=A2SNH8_METPP|nr:putative phosphorous metabolism-related protein [Methylibium petroleiphilum PM1]